MKPITPQNQRNAIVEDYNAETDPVRARYIKVGGKNMGDLSILASRWWLFFLDLLR